MPDINIPERSRPPRDNPNNSSKVNIRTRWPLQLRTRAFAASICLLAGCAMQQPKMTRDQYLQTTQRTYQGKSPDDIFRAAEKLFTLADGDDFTLHYTDDSMTATRPWAIFLVISAAMGTDTWHIKTKEEAGTTKVSALVSTNFGTITPVPTSGGDWSASGLPSGGNLIAGTAIYDIFWARMDYLLGVSDRWMSCEEANTRKSAGVTWGPNDPLCNSFNLKDATPESASIPGP